MGLLRKKQGDRIHSFIDTEDSNSLKDYQKSVSRSSRCYRKRSHSLLTQNNIKFVDKHEND